MSPVILPVPHLPQRQPTDCLAACAAMILLYLGLTPNYEQLLKLLRIRPEMGTPAYNVRELEKLGVRVSYKQGTLVELAEHLAHNRPCLTPVQTGELPHWAAQTKHAVVVRGLDDDDVYVNDPAFTTAPIVVPRGDFDLAWLAQDEYYAVITRPG